MNSSASLDDILNQIEQDSISVPPLQSAGAVGAPIPATPSVGMQDISAHLTIDTGNPAAVSAASPGQELWESNLTERQRALPKLSLKMLGGVAAVFVLMLGLGSATFLSQQNQDLRQQAYVDTLPDLAGESAVLTEQELTADSSTSQTSTVESVRTQVEQLVGQTPSPIADLFLGGIVIGGIGLVLIALMTWLFSD